MDPWLCTHVNLSSSMYFNRTCSLFPRSVLRCDVQGRVVMKCFLSGMPDVKLGLNDKLEVRVLSRGHERESERMILGFCALKSSVCAALPGTFLVQAWCRH